MAGTRGAVRAEPAAEDGPRRRRQLTASDGSEPPAGAAAFSARAFDSTHAGPFPCRGVWPPPWRGINDFFTRQGRFIGGSGAGGAVKRPFAAWPAGARRGTPRPGPRFTTPHFRPT